MWNESIDKDKNKGAMCFGVSRSTLREWWEIAESGGMRYASCYRMCAIYISKSNFIRRALCIHWNRIWNVYIWLDSFFHLMLSGIVKKTQQKRKKLKRKKNIMVDIWVILEMPLIYRSSERVCIWMNLFDFFFLRLI